MTTLLLEIFLLCGSILPATANDHDYTFKPGGVPVNRPLYLNKLQSIRSLSSVYKLDAPAVAPLPILHFLLGFHEPPRQ
jgi:hypothetical protein